MELHPLGFLTGVGVDVLDLDDLRHILHDGDESVDFIDLNNVNDLLLEELKQS